MPQLLPDRGIMVEELGMRVLTHMMKGEQVMGTETVVDCKSCAIGSDEEPFIGNVCVRCYITRNGEDSVHEVNGVMMPKFNSIDEMVEFNKKYGPDSAKVKPKTTRKSRSQKKQKNPPTDPVDNGVKTENESPFVYQARHVYTRPGDKFGTVKNDIRDMKKFDAENILYFAHAHIFRDSCNDECTEIV